ncbi:MAG: hypothetical protein ACFFCE_01250 [Promethearchaeota archaeon]
MFLKISSKKGSKYANEVNNKRKNGEIIEKFENSLDILYSMLLNIVQLKSGARIGMTVSLNITRDTSRLFTDRINKLHSIIDEYKEVLIEKIIEKIGKFFDIIAPTGLLNPEDFLKSDIALNILKEFINKYNRASSCFTHIPFNIKKLTDLLIFEGDFKNSEIIKDQKFFEAFLKLLILISRPRKGVYDIFS